MYFKDIEFLWLLLAVFLFVYFLKSDRAKVETLFSKEVLQKVAIKRHTLSKKSRSILLILAFVSSIFALARPQIDHGDIEVKSSFVNVVAAIDMSKSMFCDDVYPNRFEFAKNKFYEALNSLKKSKVALIGFSSQTFLISPLTEDFHSLKFLTKNLKLDYLSLKGTDILATLKSANNLFGDEKNKIVLLFTDGGDSDDFSKEIEYAKEHKITVYIYNIGTEKGGVIKDKNGVIKDKNGDIVVVKRNDKIKELALKTGGAYLKYSLNKDDIKLLTDAIAKKHKAKEESSTIIKDRVELFYYPLALSIVLFFISLFSLPRRSRA